MEGWGGLGPEREEPEPNDRDDPYLRRAQEALDAAKRRRDAYRGPCSECAHSRSPIADSMKCSHPAVELVAFNLPDRSDANYIVDCEDQRSESSVFGPVVCGPNGALFEKRVGFFARLFGVAQ